MGLVGNSGLCRETLKCQNVHATVVFVELGDDLLAAAVGDPNHVLAVFDGERVSLRRIDHLRGDSNAPIVLALEGQTPTDIRLVGPLVLVNLVLVGHGSRPAQRFRPRYRAAAQ